MGQWEPLHLRYRKGIAVLGFLAAHSGRLMARGTVAELLWPQLDSKGARSNLRVVLSDLLLAFRQLGLQDALAFQRDWLMLDSALLLSEPVALQELASPQGAQSPLAVMADGLLAVRGEWLAGAEEGASNEYCEWLRLQRHGLQKLRDKACANLGRPPVEPEIETDEEGVAVLGDKDAPEPDDDTLPAHGAPQAVLAKSGAAAPEMALLALLRVELAMPAESVDLGSEDSPMTGLVASFEAEAAAFGGELVACDPMGCVIAFGLGSLHAGYRWQAFRAAIHLWTLAGAVHPLSMGLTVGRLLVLREGGSVKLQGWRMPLLSRLVMCADPGQLVCCESLADIAVPLGFHDAGVHRFRGFESVFNLYVHNLDHSPPLPLPAHGGDYSGSFIARQDVLDHAEQLRQQAAQGFAAALSIGGEPGLGKTRVAWEFAQRQHARGGRVFWVGARPEAQHVAWGCLYDALTALVPGIGSLQVRLNRLLAHLGVTLEGPSRQALIGLLNEQRSPLDARGDLVRAMVALLQAPPGEASVCIIDDAQWLDPSSADLLDRVAREAPAVLWLKTVRAGATDPLLLDQALLSRTGSVCRSTTLAPLDDTSALALVQGMSEYAPLSEPELKGMIANARGVPLFLLADTAATGGVNGHFGEFCSAMLNRMGEDRVVLQTAALRGMLFAQEDLRELCGERAVAHGMARAEALGFVLSRGSGMFAFFHPRLREFLLDTLPAKVRQDLAARWALLLQQREEHSAAAALWELTKELGQARACWNSAAKASRVAGDLLAACGAYDRLALIGYGQGLEGLDQRANHISTVCGLYGYGSRRALDLAERALEEMTDLQGHPEAAYRLLALGYVVGVSRGHTQALPYALRMKAIAVTQEQHFYALAITGTSQFSLGNFESARTHFALSAERGSQLEPHQRRRYFPSDIQVFVQVQQAWLQWLMGDASSSQTLQRALEQARANHNNHDMCIFHAYCAMLCWASGDVQGHAEHSAQALEIAHAEGLVMWQAIAGLQHLQAQARLTGQADGRRIEQLIALVSQADRNYAVPARLFGVCALDASQQHADALALLDDTLSTMEPGEHLDCLMDLWRLKAQSHTALGQRKEAALAWAHACRIAHEGGALGWLAQWHPVRAAA
jgi:tetratricopeptide (TPR) repeat protein